VHVDQYQHGFLTARELQVADRNIGVRLRNQTLPQLVLAFATVTRKLIA
jgi:hypothetical protein